MAAGGGGTGPVGVRPARFPADLPGLRRLLEDYFRAFQDELGPQPFREELSRLDRAGYPYWVAEREGRLVGCCALKPWNAPEKTAELKRMFVALEARGGGAGRLLAEAALAEARRLGARRVVLDTTPGMVAARRLYSRLGFRECAPYYATSPLRSPVFMEKWL